MSKPRFKRSHLALIGLQRCREVVQFYLRDFSAPYPTFVKRKTLISNAIPDANWIETGTYMGSTSKFLAKRYPKVTTIEPSDFFFQFAESRLDKCINVEILFGQSEIHFESALSRETEHVNIWLDGHFSDGGTFQGENVSPIIHELEVIARYKSKFKSIIVFVDDVRLFKRSESHVTEYPPFVFLLEWAQNNGFTWEIQNDIYIAKFTDKISY